MKYVSCLFISSDQKSLRSSIILLLIKYLNLFLKFCLVVESWLWQLLLARLISEMLSQKNCSGEWTTHPQTFFNTSFDTGKASKLPDSFFQENLNLEGCQRWEKLHFFFEFLKFLLWISLRIGYRWKAYSFP